MTIRKASAHGQLSWKSLLALLACISAMPFALHAGTNPGGQANVSMQSASVECEGEAPTFLESRTKVDGAPLWVSAEKATRPDGTLDWDVLGDEVHRAFDQFAADPAIPYSMLESSPGAQEMSVAAKQDDPDGTTTIWYHYGLDSVAQPFGHRWNSLEELSQKATVIYLGRVVGISEGFFEGGPASLLTIRIDGTMLAEGDHSTAGDVYLYYPEARFSIGKLNFWKSNPGYPPRPEMGDRILVADDRSSPDLAGRVVLPNPSGIFIESGGSGLAVKGSLNSLNDHPQSLASIVAELQGLLTAREVD